jgi:hypothetical protein
MNLSELEKIADFYMVDLLSIIDDIDSVIEKSPIKLNHKSVSKQDFDTISQFGRIVKNYCKMLELEPVQEKRNRLLNKFGI